MGGTNRISNIVPVCVECHIRIHSEKFYKYEYQRLMNGETFSSTDVIGQKSKQKSNKEILDGISDTTRNALSKYVECHFAQ